MTNTLGDVGELNNFYEYQLYCKSLYASIQDFNKAAMKACKDRTEEEYVDYILDKFDIEDRRKNLIFTIDQKKQRF